MKKTFISYRRAGLGDCLINAAMAWVVAKKEGYDLLIAWFNSPYLEQELNAWTYYFDVPNEIEGVRLINKHKSFMLSIAFLIYGRIIHHYMPLLIKNFKLKAFKYRLPDRELFIDTHCNDIVFSRKEMKPFMDKLKLRYDLQSQVEQFARNKFTGKIVIGVHIRSHPPLAIPNNHIPYWAKGEDDVLQHICEHIAKTKNRIGGTGNQVIFLCSDSPKVIQFIKGRYENVICYNEKTYNRNIEVQLAQKSKRIRAGKNQADNTPINHEDTFIEMFLLAKCDVLMRYTKSWFSAYATYYVDKVIHIPPP